MKNFTRSQSFRPGVALAVAVLLLFIPVVRELNAPGGTTLEVPQTPSDRSPGNAATWWRFLDQARDHLPDGASYTIRADDRIAEMRLLTIALGILPDHEIRPASYFGQPTQDGGRSADYVLVFGSHSEESDLALVAKVDRGAVYRRTSDSQ